VIRPEVGADPDVVAAMMIAAINQHIADAGNAHLAEGDLLRGGRHGIPNWNSEETVPRYIVLQDDYRWPGSRAWMVG
jgi:hypothetical protein